MKHDSIQGNLRFFIGSHNNEQTVLRNWKFQLLSTACSTNWTSCWIMPRYRVTI